MEITEEQIELLENPKNCFFQYKEHQLKCPGLVVAEILLPIARSSNLFFSCARSDRRISLVFGSSVLSMLKSYEDSDNSS
jgi:hypothetical protein